MMTLAICVMMVEIEYDRQMVEIEYDRQMIEIEYNG